MTDDAAAVGGRIVALVDVQKVRELWMTVNTYLIVYDAVAESSGPVPYDLVNRLADVGEKMMEQIREIGDAR